MAAAKRRLFHAFRISRKLALLSGGFLFVLGASGTAALVFAPAGLIPGYSRNASGYCKTIYQSDFRSGREKRLKVVIATEDLNPAERVRTGVRIARHLAERLKPDLVIVQVADLRGPTARSELRGPAIGTEIVHAPNPSKSLAVSKPWEVRYVDTAPTQAGYYFGPRVEMRLLDIETINHEIELVQGCDGDPVEDEPKTASADKVASAEEGASAEAIPEEPAKSSNH